MKFIIIKVGHKYFKMDIVLLIVDAMKLSKTEVKRLMKEHAVEIYLR
jgi:hypothetical protein